MLSLFFLIIQTVRILLNSCTNVEIYRLVNILLSFQVGVRGEICIKDGATFKLEGVNATKRERPQFPSTVCLLLFVVFMDKMEPFNCKELYSTSIQKNLQLEWIE